MRLPGKGAGAVGRDVDPHMEGLLRQERGDVLWPFDQAQGTAVEVVVEADVERFLQLLNAVEVKVIERFAGDRTVFVYNGEGRRTDGVFPNAEYLAEGRREGGFAGAHGGMEGDDAILGTEGFEESAGGAGEVGETLNLKSMLLHGGTKLH